MEYQGEGMMGVLIGCRSYTPGRRQYLALNSWLFGAPYPDRSVANGNHSKHLGE